MRFRPEFRRSLRNIFNELSNPYNKNKINRKSAVAADLVTLGDSWLNSAIGKRLIEPMRGAEDQDWFHDLSDKWKVRMHCTICFHYLAFVSLRSRLKNTQWVFICCIVKEYILPWNEQKELQIPPG